MHESKSCALPLGYTPILRDNMSQFALPRTRPPALWLSLRFKVGSSEMNFAGKLCFPILPQGSVKRSGFGWGGRIRLRLNFLESQPPATHSPACVVAEPTQLKVGSCEMNFAGKLCFPILPQGSVKRSGFGWGGRIRLRLNFLESQPPATHSPACVVAEPAP